MEPIELTEVDKQKLQDIARKLYDLALPYIEQEKKSFLSLTWGYL